MSWFGLRKQSNYFASRITKQQHQTKDRDLRVASESSREDEWRVRDWRTERLNGETNGDTLSDGTQFQSPKSPKESQKLSLTMK
ncbi:hypothetical protein F2Q68_00037287 [Brassica cretica]|uniref:Uncharacterized protein n=2 Tax=Brassica cretica TaxID=69181 RepID=A0A8S9HA24_BRACR|nr:hypothetical protein F2Q68_00037287 [Brassica cretica]KAF3590519.1 hypothetical protein DY000_02027090 [Brassica cretica]